MNCPIPKKCFAGCGASLLYLVLFQLTSSNEACVSFSSLAGSAGRGAVWALALPLADRLWLLSTRSLDHRATKVRTRGYGGLQGSVSLLGKLCSLNLQSVGSQMLGLMLLVWVFLSLSFFHWTPAQLCPRQLCKLHLPWACWVLYMVLGAVCSALCLPLSVFLILGMLLQILKIALLLVYLIKKRSLSV